MALSQLSLPPYLNPTQQAMNPFYPTLTFPTSAPFNKQKARIDRGRRESKGQYTAPYALILRRILVT
jgi:hypothetical protein